MAIMAKWRDRTWEVSARKIAAVENLAFAYEQLADNNTSTEGAAQTNERGMVPFTLSFQSTLHSGAGVDIRAEIAAWQALVTKAGVLYINGQAIGPRLQLRKLDVGSVKLDDFGRMRLAMLSFSFAEYNATTTSVPDSTATRWDLTTEQKAELAIPNAAAIAAAKVTFAVGQYVKIVGSKYTTGQTVPQWVKDQTHVISQISGAKALLGHPNGINSWVLLADLSMV